MRTVAAAIVAIGVCACGGGKQHAVTLGAGGKINVVTTISTLNSFVIGAGGDKVRVTNIVPVGASPGDVSTGAAGRRDGVAGAAAR